MHSIFVSGTPQGWYAGWRRVLIHLLFWVLVFFYEAVRTSFSLKELSLVFFLVTLRKVLTMMAVHYAFAYYVIPRVLLQARWVPFFLCLVLTYVFLIFTLYYGLWLQQYMNMVPVYNQQFVHFYLERSFSATLVDPIRMYNSITFYSILFSSLLLKTTKEFFRSSSERLNLEKQKLKLEKENIKLELSFLKSQINPHFFFNTLNNIYSLIEDKDEAAANILLQLSDLMRYTLYESNHSSIPLQHEVKFIRDYVELERIRHKHNVTINLHSKELAGNFEIAPLILINFVENAFKHGVKSTIAASQVDIRIELENGTLLFFVQNSKPDRLSRDGIHGGIGLLNARRRLELIYPGQHELTIKNEPALYTVCLKIELHEKNNQLRDSRRRAAGPRTHREVH